MKNISRQLGTPFVTVISFAFAFATPLFADTVPSTVVMKCALRVPPGGLPAIPRFSYEIADDEAGTGYLLVETPLRPLGRPASAQALAPAAPPPSAYQAPDGTQVTISGSREELQSAVVRDDSGLVYDCVQPCGSRHYDPRTDRCVYPGSIVPLPGDSEIPPGP